MRRRRRNPAGRSASTQYSRPRLWKVGKVWHHAKGPGSLFGSGKVTINRSRRRKSRKAARRNPVIVRYGRKVRRSSRRRNPVYRRRSRRTRRNPFNIKRGFKGLMQKNTLVMIGSMGAGIVASLFLKGQVEKFMEGQPSLSAQRKFSGVASVVLGGMLFIMGRKAMLKQAGAAMAATGLYDLVQQNTQFGLPEINAFTPAGLGASYPVNYAPVSRVAMGASYPGNAPAGYLGTSYQAPDSSTQGFSGGMDNPFEDIFQG